MVLGYDELKENRIKVKNMKSGDQVSLSLGDDFVRNFLHKYHSKLN